MRCWADVLTGIFLQDQISEYVKYESKKGQATAGPAMYVRKKSPAVHPPFQTSSLRNLF